MMGSFDVNAKPGSLELTGMASTRMMCPDMTTENNVLNAFAQVKGYKKAGKDKVYLLQFVQPSGCRSTKEGG